MAEIIETLRFVAEPTAVSSSLTWTRYPLAGGTTHYPRVSQEPADDVRGILTLSTGVDDNYVVADPTESGGTIAGDIRLRVRVRVAEAFLFGAGFWQIRTRLYQNVTEVYDKGLIGGDVIVPTEYDMGWVSQPAMTRAQTFNLNFRIDETSGAAFGTISVKISEIYVDLAYKQPNPMEKTILSASPAEKTMASIILGEKVVATYSLSEKVVASHTTLEKTMATVPISEKTIASSAPSEKVN